MQVFKRFSNKFFPLLFVLSFVGEALATPSVSKIKVEGNQRIEKAAILDKMSIRVGRYPDPASVRKDIARIFAMGYFEDIRFDLLDDELTVRVRERPIIYKIAFEGSDEFEEKELLEASELKLFKVLKLSEIQRAQESIRKMYEDKGYYLARAPYRLVTNKKRNNEVELLFNIQENQAVSIRRIFLSGNEYFASSEIKKIMASSQVSGFSWMSGGGTYRQAYMDRDLQAIGMLYANDGFIEAQIKKPVVTLSQDRRYIDIVIEINEGQQYKLGEVNFQGDDIFTAEQLQKSFEMKKSDVFSAMKLQEQIVRISDKYGDKGYAYVNVVPQTRPNKENLTVDLLFAVQPGEIVQWGEIKVTGNYGTLDRVIRRELPFGEGERYSSTKRKKGVERVRRLGYFGPDIKFITKTPPGRNNVIDLEIKVEEKSTGTINASLGYGSSGSFSFGGALSQNNLFGRGQRLMFSAQVNKEQQVFQLSYNEPRLNDGRWSMGIDLFRTQRDVGGSVVTYKEIITGGSVTFGREIYEDLILSGTYTLQHSFAKDPVSTVIFTDPAKDPKYFTSSLTMALTRDMRNNRLDPSDGYYLSLSTEWAGLGGRPFQKHSFNARYYKRLFSKVVARSNLELSNVHNIFGASVPDLEKFVVGGIFDLRGYRHSSIGNYVPLTIAGTPIQYVKGARNKIIFQQEVEFPLIPEADIRAVFFFDIGNSFDSFKGQSPALLADYGWGIRWYSPMGPLRFEFGYPLHNVPNKVGKGMEFQFIIAPSF